MGSVRFYILRKSEMNDKQRSLRTIRESSCLINNSATGCFCFFFENRRSFQDSQRQNASAADDDELSSAYGKQTSGLSSKQRLLLGQ